MNNEPRCEEMGLRTDASSKASGQPAPPSGKTARMRRLAWNFAFENVGRAIFLRHGSDNNAFMKMTSSILVTWRHRNVTRFLISIVNNVDLKTPRWASVMNEVLGCETNYKGCRLDPGIPTATHTLWWLIKWSLLSNTDSTGKVVSYLQKGWAWVLVNLGGTQEKL